MVKIKSVQRSGFTLIELLVVISIIAVLMSIMMPALAKVREQSGKVVCSTNMKQLGYGFMMYSETYNGMIVHDRELWRTPLNYNQVAKPWDVAIAPMLDSKSSDAAKKYLKCPGDRKKRVKDTTATYVNFQGTGEVLGRSYSANIVLYNWSTTMSPALGDELRGDRSDRPAKLANVKNPGKTLLLLENHVGAGEQNGNQYGNVQGTNHFSEIGRQRVYTSLRGGQPLCTEAQNVVHSDGGNFAFIDGHVTFHKLVKSANFDDGEDFAGIKYPFNWQWNK